MNYLIRKSRPSFIATDMTLIKHLACVLVLAFYSVGCYHASPPPHTPTPQGLVSATPPEEPSNPIPPIHNADPSVRHTVKIHAPAELRVERVLNELRVTSTGTIKTNVTVGTNMVTGVICSPKVYRNGDLLNVGGCTLQGGLPDGGEYYNHVYRRELDGIPKLGEDYVVNVTLVLFETDMPLQPHWQPQAGLLYKVLWSQTIQMGLVTNNPLSDPSSKPAR